MFEGNVIPYIGGEEEKVKKETVKLLGEFSVSRIKPAEFKIACKCNRIPIVHGNMMSAFIETIKSCTVKELKETWRNYRGSRRD